MHALLLLLIMLVSAGALAAEPALQAELEGLRPFLDKTFRGELPASKSGKKQIDVQHWERALNGRAIRNLHSINNGEYGGETIIYWDSARKQIRYWYFTTAQYFSEGSITIDGRSFSAHETVTGDPDGVTEVKSTGTLGADGIYRTESQYLENGTWVPGHGGSYREAPDARVIFR